ncbi:ragulator complex protein LAMTOR1-like [Dendronephthya gigantea]|uniref:ragulator complex protein LAMTOR1-like n=1 Tax=Dendronephthya gigantea TaxID=151771 RepID=UPI00106D348D|nr:ragulator complex protein LAMTOR1-like [Dendronephthya gigantea]
MGCCFSNDEVNGQTNKDNERTPLIKDGTGAPQTTYPQAISDGPTEKSGSFNQSDQQSMLSRILNQTANNVIDVTTVEPHSLEKGEFMERTKQYQHYDNTGSSSSRIPPDNLPPGTAAPQVVLAAEPVSKQDINLVKNFSEQNSSALRNFEVSGGEPFVVQFGAT